MPDADRWTDPQAEAGSSCSNPTGRTTRWTSSPPPPREFEALGIVSTARRCLAEIETAEPVLFVGVELSPAELTRTEGDLRAAPMDAVGRALGREPVKWPVNLVLLDVAQDPVGQWMRDRVRPFYQWTR
ncbi:hypothetical protein SHIRM173S_05620 [Streptomyces hirsutus]